MQWKIILATPDVPGLHISSNSGYQMGWEGRSPSGCDTLPIIDVLEAQEKGDRL